MNHWNDIPFLRISASFIFGVWFQRFLAASFEGLLPIACLAALVGIGFLMISRKRISSKPALWLLTLPGFALLGLLSTSLNIADEKPSQPIINEFNKIQYYTAIIIGTPEKTARSVRYRAEIKDVMINDRWTHLEKDAIIYVKDRPEGSLRYGDLLLIKGTLSFLESNKNPHAFDYSLYLQRKGIWMQGFAFGYHRIHDSSMPSVREIASHSADFLDGLLRKYISGDRELNVARAMILGRRNEVSPEMESAYQATGTSHILAVSGLHVGIIYLTLSFLLSFLKYGRFRLFYFGAILFGIWSFALITGLSPSVQRAATMISFFIVAKLLNREGNIYYTLFASAFFILLFSPTLIYSVSFQLSYLAVFGIVYLYNSIYGWARIKNPILNFFWKITALSISVQLATFPVTVFYFHQFPALFAVTNLLAIPTATLVMIGGMALLMFSGFAPAATLLGNILSGWIGVYNGLLIFISKLPITTIEHLYLKAPMVFLLMGSMAFFVRFTETKQLVFFRFFTLLLISTLAYSALDTYKSTRQISITRYSVRDGWVCDVFMGQTCFSASTANEEELNYSVWPNRHYHGITTVKPLGELSATKLSDHYDLVVLQGKTFLFLKKSLSPTASLGMKVDYLVVPDNSVTIPANIDYGELVIDKVSQNTSMEKASKPQKIKDQGAWSIRL